jgi:hypothetical protein
VETGSCRCRIDMELQRIFAVVESQCGQGCWKLVECHTSSGVVGEEKMTYKSRKR